MAVRNSLRGDEILLRQQRRHQAGQRAAALMEFHRWRAPGGIGAGGLTAGQSERARHRVGIEVEQPAGRGRSAERAENSRPVPAARAEHRIIGTDADPRRHFAARRDGNEEVAT